MLFSALSDHQAAVSSLLGTTPKSMLWNTLFDMYFLLLRICYGEPLHDCGGGSLASNCALLLYEMLTADMFEKDSQVDQPEHSQHALSLSSGFLAACSLLLCGDNSRDAENEELQALALGIADAAPMAALTCILFHNTYDDSGDSSETSENQVHPNRRWVIGRTYFLRGLLISAGRRRASGVEDSGCTSTRGPKHITRPSSFVDWNDEDETTGSTLGSFKHSLRPMLTYFVVMDQMSCFYSASMREDSISDNADMLAMTVETCRQCKSLEELLAKTNSNIDTTEIVDLFKQGMELK